MKLLKYKISILLILGCSPISLLAQDFVWDTTFMVSGNRLEFNEEHYSPTHSFLKFSKNGSLIFLDSMDYTGPNVGREFVDFNQDGYIDLKITWTYNTWRSWLYLFDSARMEFIRVSGFWDFPDAQIIKNDHDYFYSYIKNGCADMNWLSHLFKIENFKTVKIAPLLEKVARRTIKIGKSE
ncbi:hypothetical protein [uncultured Roseivirga sp.]|uniref:hypothetical protein n=1 Tax=uncultured Roseivirga sp. TaxID=543088 RepID=UPI0030D96DF4|tara:strand:- start:113800 stop:114342 length:543 start_codon:yes stop_codon:yes gene_type:complete